MHTRIPRCHGVQLGIVSYMQDGRQRHLQRLRCAIEDAHIGLGKTRALHVKAVLKKVIQPDLARISVAIGNRHHRPARCQKLQRLQSIVEQAARAGVRQKKSQTPG